MTKDRKPLCLDCRWCRADAGLYGATRYRCVKLGKDLSGPDVDGPACPSSSGRFVA